MNTKTLSLSQIDKKKADEIAGIFNSRQDILEELYAEGRVSEELHDSILEEAAHAISELTHIEETDHVEMTHLIAREIKHFTEAIKQFDEIILTLQQEGELLLAKAVFFEIVSNENKELGDDEQADA